MAIFSGLPEPFPLAVSLKTRPVDFRLANGTSDRIVIVLLALVWALAIPALLLSIAEPWAPWTDDRRPLARAFALLALVVYLAVYIGRWIAPAVWAALSTANVRIGETDVTVEQRTPLTTRSWSTPIADFEGVAIESWGTRSDGPRHSPVAAIVLRHRDRRLSIPLAIADEFDIKAARARRLAETLALPFLDGETAARALDPNVLVANAFQASKARALYLLFAGGGLVGAGALAYAAASGAGPGALAGAMACLALAAAMHVFAGLYVTRLEVSGGDLEITTLDPLRRRVSLPRSEVASVAHRRGKTITARQSVEAPWLRLAVKGRRLPYIIDLQAEHVDEARIRGLGSGSDIA